MEIKITAIKNGYLLYISYGVSDSTRFFPTIYEVLDFVNKWVKSEIGDEKVSEVSES